MQSDERFPTFEHALVGPFGISGALARLYYGIKLMKSALSLCLAILFLTIVAPAVATAQTTAMNGFCPVTILNSKKWEKGDQSIKSVYDNRIYYFVNSDAKKTFDANPPKYVPSLGGDCIVCLINVGKRIPGSVYFSVRHKNRLYLFPQDEAKKVFKDDPEKYEDGDLAFGGKCPVCRKGGKDETGKKEFTFIHKDMRYRFASKEIMDEFKRNPENYIN